MILEPRNWYLGYSQILADCRTSRVDILVDQNVDSLAAARILSYMLRQDAIAHSVTSINSIPALQAAVAESTASAIVLLNLGSRVSLQLPDPNATIYVMDARRPVHLANIHNPNVVLFWDGTQGDDPIPSDGDNLSGNEESSEDESESSEDESDDDDDSQVSHDSDELEFDDAQETAENPQDAMDDDDSDNNNNQENQEPSPALIDQANDSDDDASARDVHKPDTQSTAPLLSARSQYEDRQNRIAAYYNQGTFYGAPAAFVAYRIASEFRFANADMLWLAILGITDSYFHYKIDMAGYSSFALALRTEVLKLFPNDDYSQIRNTVYAGDLYNTNDQTKLQFSEKGRLLCESDFRFFLLRQSSLYESMTLSNYVSQTLAFPQGIPRLHELLAKMGVSLEECKQKYEFMKPSTKAALRDKFREHAEDYGLVNLEYTGFFRITGYQKLTSAADTVYCVSSMLEHKSFQEAYDALLTFDFHRALASAKLSQSKIIQTATSLFVDRKAITRLSHFRYAFIPRSEYTFCPLELTRLAHYMLAYGKWSVVRPLVLLAEGETHYSVIGYETDSRNKFGRKFELAADSMAGDFRFDHCDSHIVQVAKADAQRFLEQLHYLLDNI